MALASDSINRETLGMVDENKQTDEVGRLVASLNNMREGMRQKMVLEESFSRYVSPTLAKAVIHDPAWHQLGGRYVNASVVFADIVGFTRLSESVQPEQLSALLNDYFGYISKAAHYFNGHVDKYIGDCAMLVFGSPEIDAKHQYHAIACAVIIQQLIETINKQRQRQGQITVKFHIGINSGKMLAGNMGSAERMNYTVIGDAVNLAARLASVAESDQIIIPRELNSEILNAGYHITTIPHGVLNLRGKQHPVDTYRVLDIDNIRSQSSEILGQIIETDVI
jgi:adenylate cyclase